MILLIVEQYTDGPGETRAWGSRQYYLWDYTTTIVWVVQIGLLVRFDKLSWARGVELAVAAYFLWDSASLLQFNLQHPDEDVDEETVIILVIVFAYLYEVVVDASLLRQRELAAMGHAEEEEQSLSSHGPHNDVEPPRYQAIV